MEYCYIGIFSSVFNWVLNKILSPVFNFISKLLSTVLSWIFNNVLAPLLENVLWPLIKEVLNLIVEILAEILFGVYAALLEILDTMNASFDYFTGLRNISYQNKDMSLLEAMFEIDGLRTAFLLITAIGLSLALLMAIIGVMQSALDFDFENKRPVSRVLTSLFRAFIQLFTVEFVVYFLIRLSGLLLAGINTALGFIGSSSTNTSIARMVFVVSSMNACSSDKELNLSGAKASSVGIGDAVRSKFYSASGLSYTDADVVKQYFNLAKFDYLIGLILCIFLLVVMAVCMVIFVQRLFDLLILYLVSPLFVGVIPLDDGEKFGRWRELFIGKCFSGFGMVMAMKLYIMLCPVIMGSEITFSDSTEMDYLTKMVFLLGGAWAVLKSGTLVTSLISSQTASSEQEAINRGSMALHGMAFGGAALIGSGLRRGVSALAPSSEKAAKSRQKFEDTRYRKNTGLGTESTGNFSAPKKGNEGGGQSSSDGGSLVGFLGPSGKGGMSASPSGSPSGSPASSGGSGSSSGSVASRAGEHVGGSIFKAYRTKSGGIEHAFSPGKGKMLKIGHDGKGNTNIRLLGFGIRMGKDGKINKISLPCVNLKRNSEGKMNVDRVRLPLNAASWKRNDSGTLKFRDCNLIGLKMGEDAQGKSYVRQLKPFGYRAEIDDSGQRNVVSLLGLFNKEKQEDGKYHVTSAAFGAVQNSRVLDDDGKLRFAGIRVLGMNFYTRDDVAERNRREREKNEK